MRRPIGQVKKEIRTLGLDTCNPRSVVGVIVRGGLYLDGVVSFPHAQNEPARNCAERIIELRYFPELRAMMLHDPKDQLNSKLLERVTKLPTIAISKGRPRHGRSYRVFQGKLGRIWVKTWLESPAFGKIFSVSWTIEKLPEPVRIAHLLAKQGVPRGPPMR